MNLITSLMHLLVPDKESQNTAITITATVTVTISLLTLLHRLFHPKRPSILPSPLKTLLPNLPAHEKSHLVYPPDAFPGARDVPTPYGSIRCYEFGPPTGRKVLLLHGISTSCMTLTHIAHGLVERGGCRVLLFDLFGRGFSDAVGDLPYDERLYITQALCVLASSELAWTGHGNGNDGSEQGFHLIGYSLGGGIAVHLATTFPKLVKSVVLLAPAGLIRPQTFGTASRFIFRSGWVPETLLEVLTRWRLKKPIADSANKRKPKANGNVNGHVNGNGNGHDHDHSHGLISSLPGEKAIEVTVTSEIMDPAVPTNPNTLQKNVLAFVHWQTSHHEGFITAFQSTVRYAPMLNQHETWKKLAARDPKTVCFIFGDGDEIVSEEDYREDALPLVGGEDHVAWPKPIRGGHDFPMVDPEMTLDKIWEFWGWK